MFDLIFKIWWMIALLPMIIFQEANDKFANFLKKRNIYKYWDIWHSLLVLAIVILIVFLANGF